MNEQQQLHQIIVGCLDQNTVHDATNSLLQLSKSPSFLTTLLGYIYQGISNESILIMTMTTYKNYLKQYYNHKNQPMSQENRKIARQSVQQLYFKISHSNVAVNIYKEVIYILVAVSYPWNGLDLSKVEEIEPNAYIFEQIGKVYEYLLEDNYRQVFQMTINQYFPLIQGYIKQILQNYDDKTSKILSLYLNMMFCSIHMELPKYLRDFNKMEIWIFYLKSIINNPVSLNGPDNQNYFLQNQIISVKILRNLIAQHCKDNSEEQYLPWINQFISQFAIQIFRNVITVLFQKKKQLHADVLSNIIRIIYTGYKNSFIRPLIMNIAQKVLFEEMIPLIDYTNQDIDLFDSDALEFIRRQEDGTVNPARWEAIEVVNVLAYFDYEGKSFLMRFIEHAAILLKDITADGNRKATILFLIAKLKVQVLKNKALKDQFGQLVSQYFFQYLSDPNPMLVYTACRLFSIYLVEVNLQTNIVQELIIKLFDCLNHNSLPVKFMSVLAFTSLLEDDSDAIQYVQPHFSTILSNYLSLIEQLDHQSLLQALQKMIKFFDKQILSVGPKLIKHLISMFYKYADRQDKQDDEEQAGFLDNPVTAALGTIRQLLDVDLDRNIYLQMSNQINQILIFIVKKNLKYCFDDIYDIYAVLVHRGQQISDFIFPYLYFRKVIDGMSYDTNLQCQNMDVIGLGIKADPSQQQTVLSILKNLIVKMPRQYLFAYPLPNTPDLILCLIENKIIQGNQLQNLDFSQVTGNWLLIIKSYASIIYSINNVDCDLNFIKSMSSSISYYPWISTISDLNIFVTIIRKVMLRFQDDDEEESSQQLTTIQMMQKYAKQASDGESDFEDGAFVDEQCSYSYRYNSPFPLKNDLILIRQKLGQLSGQNSQIVANNLGKNQYPKLMKLIADVDSQKI